MRDCREVYGVAAIAYCRPPECLGRSVILGWSKGHARGLSCLQCVEHEFLWLGCLRASERARLLRDVVRDVAIDGDNEVGDTKERSRSACNEHRRHPKLIEEGSDAVDKGCDGFLVGGDQGTHELISDHEVRGRRVLVHQQRRRTGSDGLDEVCGLRGGAAGVSRAKRARVDARGQVGDERGDVRPRHRAAVLRPHAHDVRLGDDPFATICSNVGIDAAFDRAKQGGLSVVPSSYDHGHALRDAHARNLAAAGQIEGDPKVLRAHERYDRISLKGKI